MNLEGGFAENESSNWICPDLTAYWKLGKVRNSSEFLLQALQDNRRIRFSAIEGYALTFFTGRFTIRQVQKRCQQKLGEAIYSDFVSQLLQKLIELEILALPEDSNIGEVSSDKAPEKSTNSEPNTSSLLKSCVQWIQHPDGYWILRNPEDVTFLQVDERSKVAIADLGRMTLGAIAQKHHLTPDELRQLLQLLATTAMLEGTKPSKPPKGKFTPLQLLFFKISLFNPDKWLTRNINPLRWIWTQQFGFFVCFLLAWSGAFALSQQAKIFFTGHQLVATQGAALVLPFALLSMLVVTLHELGHAFTLKYYGGIVPDVGLMFMFFIPAAYTNTTDAYCLVKRRQRVLVVAAGVVCQLIIAAGAFWLWQSSASWLHTTSYLLMAAALFTVALNLNPLSKFDGYYLAVALSGINNLRSRSFGFYANLLQGRASREEPSDQRILAAYAPCSLAYTLLVFGSLLGFVTSWTLTHIPITALTLLALWAIYFYFPADTSSSTPKPQRPHPTPASATMLTPNSANPANNSSPSPQLKVVPPPTTGKNVTPQPTAPHADVPNKTPTSAKSTSKWLILSGITVGLVGIGFIPIANSVTGKATIEPTPGSRKVVTMTEPAVVEKIYVRPNSKIVAGQRIAQLSSNELDDKLADIDQKFQEASSAQKSASEQQSAASSRLQHVRYLAQTAAHRANELQQDFDQMVKGNPPPHILALERTKEERHKELDGLQKSLNLLETEISRDEKLVQQGVLPSVKLDEPKRARAVLEGEIAAKTQQISTTEAQIDAAKKEMHLDLNRRKDEAGEKNMAVQSAEQEVKVVAAEVQKWEKQILLLQAEQEKLQDRSNQLTVLATMSGTVITQDIDQWEGQKLPEGKELLQIVDLSQLTAVVEIQQEDAELIKQGMSVRFRPPGIDFRAYDAKVEEILPVAPSEPSQQKPIVKVRISFENPDVPLFLGTTGYAHIQPGKIPIYQKIKQEFLKLVPLGGWF